MPSIRQLKKLQALSGLIFGVFLVMHLLTHYSLNLGWDTAHSYQQLFRRIYQHPRVEIVIFGSLVVHMYSNTMIYIYRGKLAADKKEGSATEKISLELKGHRYAGYFLAFSIFGHVAATRIGPMFIMDDASEYDYGFISKANELLPSNLFLGYLVVLGATGVWHLIYGTRSAIATLRGKSVMGTKFPISLKMVALTSHILIISACLALGGFYYTVDLETKTELHDKLFSAMGMH